jgi:hypothetical protein
LVSGSVSSECGDKDIPSYFTRLDYPEIATFIAAPDNGAIALATKSADTITNIGGPLIKGKFWVYFTKHCINKNDKYNYFVPVV